jgi:hypothetical protein
MFFFSFLKNGLLLPKLSVCRTYYHIDGMHESCPRVFGDYHGILKENQKFLKSEISAHDNFLPEKVNGIFICIAYLFLCQ